jgi:hypothetical protein
MSLIPLIIECDIKEHLLGASKISMLMGLDYNKMSFRGYLEHQHCSNQDFASIRIMLLSNQHMFLLQHLPS